MAHHKTNGTNARNSKPRRKRRNPRRITKSETPYVCRLGGMIMLLQTKSQPKQIASEIFSTIEPHTKEIIEDMLYHETRPYLENILKQVKIKGIPLHIHLRKVTAYHGSLQSEIRNLIEFDIDNMATEMLEEDMEKYKNTMEWGK